MEPVIYNDVYGREFKSLRISLTQFCNFSCLYCVPEGSKFKKLEDELSPEEFGTLLRIIHKAVGLEKLRITGGEPVTYYMFDDFIRSMGEFDTIEKSITTNASKLEEKSELLWNNGFKRINISIDSIDPETFRKISRGGNYKKVMAGIERCRELGFKIKFNMVPMRTVNYSDIIDLLDYSLKNGIELRYIELMKMGHVKSFFDKEYVSKAEILDLISKRFGYKQVSTHKSSTSERFLTETGGHFGIIANESSSFCSGCNRLRLTSNGYIYGCISAVKNYNARPLLKLTEEEAINEIKPMLIKAMGDKQIDGFSGAPTYMKHIGG